MKKYKNYIIGLGILILGIFLGNIFSGGENNNQQSSDEHNYVQDSITKKWTCSMHPQIILDKPGSCPICGMDLIALDQSNVGDNISPNEVVMTEEAIQLANIQTSEIVKSDALKEIRLLGVVKPDERRLFSQVSHIPGRIERLYVNFTGEKIRKGQKIARIYSPELISAQKELFEAIKSKEIYPQLYKASRNKLRLWKLSNTQIDAIINSGKVQEQIDILSDYSGYVMKRNVELGDHVMEGMKLFNIANIDNVWVMFEAYEVDIPWIRRGDDIEFNITAIPEKTFKGKVTYIDPFVSANTRVSKVRVEVKNSRHKLLPEMYANGIIKAKLNKVNGMLVIPKSAVLWTGKRAVVYVKVPHKKIISFIYREIILGADLGDFYVVEKGLKEGENVATNGVFRIDASAQLLGKKSMMNPDGSKINSNSHTGMDMGGDKKEGVEKKDEDMSNMIMIDKTKIDKNFKKQLGFVVSDYIELKNSLVDSDMVGAKNNAVKVKESLAKVDMLLLLGDSHNIWMKFLKPMNKSIEVIKNSKSIEEQRKMFSVLGKNLSDAVNELGIETLNNKPLYLEFCPMVNDNHGAYWLSFDKEIKNPYYGEQMLTCGEVITQY